MDDLAEQLAAALDERDGLHEEITRLWADRERMRAVVEAALVATRNHRHWESTRTCDAAAGVDVAYDALDAAVDTYETQEGTE